MSRYRRPRVIAVARPIPRHFMIPVMVLAAAAALAMPYSAATGTLLLVIATWKVAKG